MFELKDNTFYKVNADQAGVYMTAYPSDRWDAFGGQRKLLTVEDRAGLVAEAKNLAASGHASTVSFLNLISEWRDEDDFVVWEQIASSLASLRAAGVFEPDGVRDV